MIRRMLTATAVAVLTAASPAAASPAAASPAAASPAAASPAAGSPAVAAPPKTTLTLVYMADAGYATAVVLTCGPAGGVHPKGKQACAALRKVDGRPELLRAAPDAMCTLEYAPITAQITGTWKGRKLDWSQKFSNSCDLARTTGVVFAF